MKFKSYFSQTPHVVNVLAAIPLSFLGILAAGFSLLVFYIVVPELPELAAKNKNALIFAIIFFPIGIGCLTIAWRLITGKNRKIDGGLLPPSIIFLFGLFFLVTPIFFIWIRHSLAFEAVSSFMSAMACFVLAKVRKNSIKKQIKE